MSGFDWDPAAGARREMGKLEAAQMLGKTAPFVWNALADAGVMQSPDYDFERSTPDYHEDGMSHPDDYTTCEPGPGYWDEVKSDERYRRSARSLAITEACTEDYRQMAVENCDRLKVLPTGATDPHVEYLDCMRMWADGIFPARESVTKPGADRTSGWEIGVHGGKTGNDKSPFEVGIEGKHNWSTTTHEPTEGREMDLPGAEGYNRRCFREGMEWFEQDRANAMKHYAD